MFSIVSLMEFAIDLESFKDLEKTIKVDVIQFQKMLLLFNSIEHGWTVKKRGDSYVFTKPHEGKSEVHDDAYLRTFMKTNLDVNKIFK